MPVADLHARLVPVLGERVLANEPLARHTSYRIGGPADLLVRPDTTAELAAVVREAAACDVRLTLLGGGSNMLVGDGGIRGVVVRLGREFRSVEWRSDSVRAGAAVQLGKLARAGVSRALSGLEHAEGIPGTVGGALFMNAGAYGGEVAGVVEAVEGLDGQGNPVALDREAVAFTYRRAHLPHGFVVTAVTFGLRPDDPWRCACAWTACAPSGSPASRMGSRTRARSSRTARRSRGSAHRAAGLKGWRVGGALSRSVTRTSS
jgi:UDP-N-acetylmuramate dehydrogenase